MRPLTRRTLGAALVGCLILSGCSEDPVTTPENQPVSQRCPAEQQTPFKGFDLLRASIYTKCEDGLAFKDGEPVAGQGNPIPLVVLNGEDPPVATGEFNMTGWSVNGAGVALSLYERKYFDFSTETWHWYILGEPETVRTQSGVIAIPFLRGACQGIGDRGTVTCDYSVTLTDHISHARMLGRGGTVGLEYEGEFLFGRGKVGTLLSWDKLTEVSQGQAIEKMSKQSLVRRDNAEEALWFGHVINVTISDMQRRVWKCHQHIGETEKCSEQTPFTFYLTESRYSGVTNFPETRFPSLSTLSKTEGPPYDIMFFVNSPNSEPTEGRHQMSYTWTYQQKSRVSKAGNIYGAISVGTTPVSTGTFSGEFRGDFTSENIDTASVTFTADVRAQLVAADLDPLLLLAVPTHANDLPIGLTVRPR